MGIKKFLAGFRISKQAKNNKQVTQNVKEDTPEMTAARARKEWEAREAAVDARMAELQRYADYHARYGSEISTMNAMMRYNR